MYRNSRVNFPSTFLEKYGPQAGLKHFGHESREQQIMQRAFQLEKGGKGGPLAMRSKILIVDDQYGIRMLLSEIFQKEGYNTFEASNGLDALRIARKEKPDLVLLDVKIPGMDGLDILRHLKLRDPDVNIIMMTAYGELDMITEAKRLGATAHFTKPFDIDELRSTVDQCLTPQITT
jgi:two-component system response regulator (stage 0 sporulation protein F)